MDNKFKQITGHVSCGSNSGTAFLVSSTHAITAYHVVSESIEENEIEIYFPFIKNSLEKKAILMNPRMIENEDIDFAILKLELPIEGVEPLKLIASNLNFGQPWEAFGFPVTKYDTGEIFIGKVSQIVQQHIFKYDVDLNCEKPVITDPDFITEGASGSAVIMNSKVVAILSEKVSGGTLGAVSIKSAQELLKEHNVYFEDDAAPINCSPKEEFDSITEMYSIRVQHYLEKKIILPFNVEINNTLINQPYVKPFFDKHTWKSRIIDLIVEISRRFGTDPFLKLKINEIQNLNRLSLTYGEFQSIMRQKITETLKNLPENSRMNRFKLLMYTLQGLVNKRFKKILLVSGESGSGKTHLLKSILSSYKFEKGLGEYSIRIPIEIRSAKEKGLKEALNCSINYYLGTNFDNITEMNEFIASQERLGNYIKIILVMDDLQSLLNLDAKYYEDIRKLIEEYTKYDWVSWCLSINVLDQYLIMERDSFLKDYCFSDTDEDNILNLFLDMDELNHQYKVCYSILENHSIDTKEIEQYRKNLNNIKMLLTNPLMAHVYANTVSENDKGLHNICYFDFIKRYSDIKKQLMINNSERNLLYMDKGVHIDKDINRIVDFIIQNKELTYSEDRLEFLLKDMSDLYSELRSVSLINKEFEVHKDIFESYTKVSVTFIFNLYWAYRILLKFRLSADWSNFPSWREEFTTIKEELLIYALLYLDTDFERNYETLKQEIIGGLNIEKEKAAILFGGIKTSFQCQEIIFFELLEKKKLNLNKQETFALMYFLNYTNAKEAKAHKKTKVISKYIDEISDNGLEEFLNRLCNKILSDLTSMNKLKKCLSEFICIENNTSSKIIGKLAAENFVRICKKNKYTLKEIVDNHIVTFLFNNLEKINSIMNSKLKKNVTFIEYFLRFLFSALIEIVDKNKFLLHEIFVIEDYYQLKTLNHNSKVIGHIIRSNSAIAYGSNFKYQNLYKSSEFKNQYLYIISELLDSGLIKQKILAFHFISNTLFDNDPNANLDLDFNPFLKRLFEDPKLKQFNYDRRDFYQRYYKDY